MPATKTPVRALDLMRTDVLVLSTDTPVREAVERFEEYRIAGAPVVDGNDRLVGFLSLKDVARSDHVADDRIDAERASWPTDGLDEEGGWDGDADVAFDGYSPRMKSAATVGDWMTPEVISVTPGATMETICKTLVEHGIHRVVVVEKGKVRGIVSTFDVVRHLARR